MTDYFLNSKQFDLLRLSGPDATRFLQGQVSCNVEALSPGACTPGAALTNKGRVYALFFLLKLEQDFLLVLNQGLAAVLLGQLRKYLPFYKCQFTETVLGGDLLLLVGKDTLATVCARLADNGVQATAFTLGIEALPATLLWLPSPLEPEVYCAGLSRAEPPQWLADALLLGHFPFTPDDAEQYTAQALRLEHHGYISFDKGCYTGQEIVARMHYRGKPKKLLCRLELAALPTPAPEAESLNVLDEHGEVLAQPFKLFPLGQNTARALAFLPAELPPCHLNVGTVESCQAL